MTPLAKNARIAGLFYLLLLAAPLRLIYIPSALFVPGDATTTAARLTAHEMLLRWGVLGDLFTGTMTLFLALAFYRLFKDVNRNLAILVVLLGGVLPCAIYFFNVMNDFAVLLLTQGGDSFWGMAKQERDALTLLFFRLHGQEIQAAEVFWGLWLLPLGWLSIRSGFIPKFLGWWLILNGFTYLALSIAGILALHIEGTLETYATPIQFGELAFMLWLLIFGAKEPPPAAT